MPKSSTASLFPTAKGLLNRKRFLLSAATITAGLFLVFTVVTAPVFSMIAFTQVGGEFLQDIVVDGSGNNPYQFMQQAYAQDGEPEIQQEEVSEEGDQPVSATGEGQEQQSSLPLTASISIDSTNGDTAPATFLFETDPEGGTGPYTYSWNFGDGSPQVTEEDIEHTFANPGMYVVTLTVTDSTGQTVTDRREVNVRPAATTEPAPPSPSTAGSNASLVGNQTGGELAVQPEPIGPGGGAANKEECKGVWVQRPDGSGFCFTRLEPDEVCLKPVNVEDPPICIRGSIVLPPGTTSTICTPTAGGTTTNTTLNQGIDQNTNQTGGGEAGLAVNDPGAEGPKVKPTKRIGANQSASDVEMLIEEACMALQNNDTQSAQMQLNLVLYVSVIGSNVTTTTGSGATNATGVNQTQAPSETIEDVQQRMVEFLNSDPRLTPEQKTQAINQLSAEVAQIVLEVQSTTQQPQVQRASCLPEDDMWVIEITPGDPVKVVVVWQCGDPPRVYRSDRIAAPSDETGEEAEAAPQTTTELIIVHPPTCYNPPCPWEEEDSPFPIAGGGNATNATGGEAEAAPQTTTEQGDPIPGLD